MIFILVASASAFSVLITLLGFGLWLTEFVPDIISVLIMGFGFLAFLYCLMLAEELNAKKKAAQQKSIRYHKRQIQIRRLLNAAHAHFF